LWGVQIHPYCWVVATIRKPDRYKAVRPKVSILVVAWIGRKEEISGRTG
jgi:hypothetical protein